jgi:hypothetical protein
VIPALDRRAMPGDEVGDVVAHDPHARRPS